MGKNKPSKLEYQEQNTPTFREFVQYVVDQNVIGMNQHWVPMYNICMPCHINYTIIGRKETITEDGNVILENIDIDDKLPEAHVSLGKSSDETLREYYSELDKKLLVKLYKLYEMDFLLFNYT